MATSRRAGEPRGDRRPASGPGGHAHPPRPAPPARGAERSRGSALLRAAHLGPTLVVTLVVTAYAVSVGPGALRGGLVPLAVLTGQLSIGWSNDLVDAGRDRAVGRTDKPLAAGRVSVPAVRAACAAALVVTVTLSVACGPAAALTHLGGCVAAGWAYNLGLKSTAWSWVPYALAFGTLPAFVTLASPGGGLPPVSVALAGALLGVGAHLLNVLPDLEDDAATGVRGLPHRLGAAPSRVLAVAVLVLATTVLLLGDDGVAWPASALVATAAAVALLAGVALRGRGRQPFRAAMALAALDVLLLVAR